MNRYERYKDSGIPWLGEVPEHWEIVPIRHLFQFKNNLRVPLSAEERGKIVEKIYPYYGASGIIDYVDNFIFDEDLILVAEDGANLLSRSTPLAFIATGKYWVNNHAHILKPLSRIIKFWQYLLQIYDFSPLISGSAQPKLTKDNLASILLPSPTVEEQTAIAHYLDTKLGEIDALIDKQQTLLEKLAEQRTAVITHAVTKGLDPAAPMKKSGVEWLGDVPAHWEVCRLKDEVTFNDETLGDKTDLDYEILYVDISNVSLNKGIIKKDLMTFENSPSRARRIVKNGDVIVSTVRTYLKAITQIKNGEENLIVSTGFVVLRPRDSLLPKFLGYWVQAENMIGAIVANSVGVSYPAINASDLVRLPIVKLPMEEQAAIADYLDTETDKIDRLCDTVNQTIGRLKEYRTALITQAVTGKIKVTDE